MFDLALKDLKQHKVRTFLTGLGIFIAITAIVSLGSISAGVNELITQSGDLIGSDTIIVMKRIDFSSMMSGPPGAFSIPDVEPEELEAVSSVPGVERVVPIISRTLPAGGFGEVDGIDMEDKDLFGADNLVFKEGSWPENGDMGAAIGYLISQSLGVGINDYITLNGKEVEVMGIFEEGSSSFDFVVLMPYAAAEEIYEPDGPTQILVEPEDISQVDAIKETIEDENDELMAVTMTDALKQAEEATLTLNVMTLGIGFVASIVAAIGIIITMYTSVLERRRDIGIMKAVGAKRRFIITNILQESLLLALASGVAGVLVSFSNSRRECTP